jgi:hypothetical protein
VFSVLDAGDDHLTCINRLVDGENIKWNDCPKAILSDVSIICTCPENRPVTIVNDELNIYGEHTPSYGGEVETFENGSIPQQEASEAEGAAQGELEAPEITERSFNMDNIAPFLVWSVLLLFVVIFGTYKDTQNEAARVEP